MEKSKDRGSPTIAVQNRQELESAIELVWLSPEYGLAKAVEYRLYKYSLHLYEPSDIIAEAFQRAAAHLEKNKEIPNLVAWLKLASYNIIRERKRLEAKQTVLLQRLRSGDDNSWSSVGESSLSSDENSRLATLLTEGLQEPDRSIILLRAESLSWREVCIKLAEQGLLKGSATDPRTIERVKKRGNRAASKLRNLIQEADKL